MTRGLLDVNVLVALLDMDHADHERTLDWLDDDMDDGWASCAITQNGVVRMLSQPRYPRSAASSQVLETLAHACAMSEHEFWACDVSLLDPGLLDRERVYGRGQLTDSYLLALAVARSGRLVTMDRSVSLAAVRGATPDHLTVL